MISMLGVLDRPLIANLGWHLARMAQPGTLPTVHIVSDGAKWAFDWVGRYLAEGLESACGQPAAVVPTPTGLAGQIVHFISRYAFLDSANRFVHLLNRTFLTWYHSDFEDPEAQRLIDAFLPIASRAMRIVVPCRITATVLERVGIAQSKLVIIPIGVDTQRFRPASDDRRAVRRRLGLPERGVIIGSFQKDGVGWGDGMEPKRIKGPDVFLEAVAKIWRRRRDLFVLLTGPARGYVKAGLDRLGIPYRHDLLQDYWSIVPYYQAIDLYLIASRCEGGPQALLESWACARPVVSTRVGMSADLIRDRENGFLAEDADTLAERSLELLADGELATRLAEAGYLDAGNHSWPMIARHHMERLYAPVLGRPAA